MYARLLVKDVELKGQQLCDRDAEVAVLARQIEEQLTSNADAQRCKEEEMERRHQSRLEELQEQFQANEHQVSEKDARCLELEQRLKELQQFNSEHREEWAGQKYAQQQMVDGYKRQLEEVEEAKEVQAQKAAWQIDEIENQLETMRANLEAKEQQAEEAANLVREMEDRCKCQVEATFHRR